MHKEVSLQGGGGLLQKNKDERKYGRKSAKQYNRNSAKINKKKRSSS